VSTKMGEVHKPYMELSNQVSRHQIKINKTFWSIITYIVIDMAIIL
jgi:hypothetical protein